ncbi:MAG: hypothetical protein U1F20_11180 [Lysobacterales bacterium]
MAVLQRRCAALLPAISAAPVAHAQSDIARASNAENTALHNLLLAGAG